MDNNNQDTDDIDILSNQLSNTNIDTDNNIFKIININDELNIDIDKLKTLVQNYFYPDMREFIQESSTGNLVLPPTFSEWMVKKSVNGNLISSGNSAMDVVVSGNKAIDVGTLCLSGSQTNEKSIMQNFTEDGANNLDRLFENEDYENIVESYRDLYKTKINSFCEANENITNLYYLIFISTNQHIYLTGYKLNKENIDNIEFDCLIRRSVKIKNVIEPNYGNAKIYKSKKRIELRFTKETIQHPFTIKLFSIND